MSSFDNQIRDLVRQTVAELLEHRPLVSGVPELITITDAAKLCGCDKSVILNLVHNAASNGFPSVRLGERLIRIDRRRLYDWLANGGLTDHDGEHHKERRTQVSGPHLQAVARRSAVR